MTLPISAKQMEVLKAFRAFTQEHDRAPSVRELCRLLDRAPSTIHQSLSALQRKGLIQNDGGAHGRRINLARAPLADAPAPAADDLVRVPIRGTIAAGAPIEAIDRADDVLVLPREQAGTRLDDDTFALRVRGDSMIDDHILDGDLVLVRPQPDVRQGEIAVALLEDGSATLKRVYRDAKRRQVRLQPANASMAPIYVDRVTIQGKVVGLWRPLE